MCAGAGGSGALSTDAAGQLDVLGHDGDALGVDGAQVGVLEEANQVGLGRLLQGEERSRLKMEVWSKLVRELPHETLERKLSYPAQRQQQDRTA